MTEIIHLPGIGNSGESHWHTLWEDADPAIHRFTPTSWDEPDLSDWVTALEEAVRAVQTPPILVAHSLACLLVAHWHQVSDLPIRGAMLVAVPDPESSVFPSQAVSFADTPQQKFRFPSLIVASTDDPYGSLPYVQKRVEQWGCDLKVIGAAGHINGQSELGDWPEGLSLLKEFAHRV
ncbi:alpha/beta fold hydrolase [Agrobacterium vitis]|jgi:predicted alpha/beta hydrolase family esterase|uniref:RBBP9/YdeN family alpha/beta hydrolase n=1 Tax=Agrobacterium vitis TaxID=373 RepID=UPI0012E752DB|nr:alpha/beta hydrolase [Agrobacterium vitis]MUZ65001.1 alpha/beta fold hydrolase [Agrobacterium vitis]